MSVSYNELLYQDADEPRGVEKPYVPLRLVLSGDGEQGREKFRK